MKKNIVQRSQNALKCGLMIVIALAFLLSANQSGAAVGDTFTDDNFKYTVLTEEGTTGTVSVARQSATIPSGAVVTIPDSVTNGPVTYGVTSIGVSAFYGLTSLTSITIPDSLTSIGDRAFSRCSSLTSVIIGNSLTSIGKQAFEECSSLTSITIPDSLTSIGRQAFEDCSSLTSITIPNSVTVIEDRVFYGCSSLTKIEVGDNNPNFSSTEGVLFNKDQTTLIKFPGGKSGSYIIPDSVNYIGNYAFNYCTSLTSITIPDSVNRMGRDAFSVCISLTSITIPDGVTDIDFFAFMSCTSLTSITIPDSVSYIGGYAFINCTGLTSVVIGNNVTTIEYTAFENCSSLASVTIPESVAIIGEWGFYGCSSLESVYFKGDAPWFGAEVFNSDPILYYIEGTAGWTTPTWNGYRTAIWGSEEPDVGDTFTDENFQYTILFIDGTTGTVSVAKQSETVPSGAVEIPSSITNGSVTYSVTSIGKNAFTYCGSLTGITIPDSVTSIGEYAFNYCGSLTGITIPDSVTSIGEGAFILCSSLTSITIPDSVKTIGVYAFEYCTGMTSAVIGNGVTEIADYAFSSCSSLESAYFKGDAPELGSEVFTSDPILYYIEGASGWTTPTWNGYRTAIWGSEEPPALSCELKEGKLILTYSGGSLQASSDLILWSPVEGAQGGKYEVDLPKTGKTFYRVAQ